MMATYEPRDPLIFLPAEVILNVLAFAKASSIASLVRVSKAWYDFIELKHQDAIFYRLSMRPPGARDLSSIMAQAEICSPYLIKSTNWKDCCKRQTLLANAWESSAPIFVSTEITAGLDVWRFRPDFRRGFCIVTHACQAGLTVIDMWPPCTKMSHKLWSIDRVKVCAHLEYDDGTMVFDGEDNTLEVWKTGTPGLACGEFERVAVLRPRCAIRGFQLSYDNLCVVTSEEQGYVYDMAPELPTLQTTMEIDRHAVGHLAQDEEVVMFSMGELGYHIHDKRTGLRLGAIHPRHYQDRFHIPHPRHGL